MSKLFHLLLIKPIFNFLLIIYNFLPWPDIGLATIILTFLIRLIFFPLFYKGTKQQILMTRLQPALKKIQEEYKDDKEKMVKAQLALYKKHKVNPLGGCLLTLIQLPIILAVYRVFLLGFSPERMVDLYSFVPHPETLNPSFLGLVNLTKPNFPLVFVSALLQYLANKMIMPTSLANGQEKELKINVIFQKQMLYLTPIMTLIILAPLPSIIALYWAATTCFTILQQWFIQKNLPVDLEKKENGGDY